MFVSKAVKVEKSAIFEVLKSIVEFSFYNVI